MIRSNFQLVPSASDLVGGVNLQDSQMGALPRFAFGEKQRKTETEIRGFINQTRATNSLILYDVIWPLSQLDLGSEWIKS